MKMRFAWYAGASAALAGAVIVSAFHQRANFYSAMVHLSQSSLSLMVLVNLVFVVYGSLIYGLQRLCFGPLRPVEIEQLYERAWFAVTETCLAMTIFREEVGAFFLVMFTALVTGKVWGWIGEGRVEVLEQQPPANPRLFHTRLSISLLLSVIYDTWLLIYAVNTVVQQARPTMMVMFLFEFAVLAVGSFHTGCRYIVSLIEQRVVKTQTHQRLEERRRQIREERAAILQRREAGESPEDEELPSEDDVDEMDIEVPGWESKGQWVLTLDLIADFIKLGIYTAFFCVLFTFYGLPIHIIRDWFMTTRSFLKRLGALIRYRQALRDMDQYPDATPEELDRENTCIICREEMHPWDPADAGQVERTRAKKLPCGHVLHFGCLKSWLERQQVCPTCRRPVAREGNQPARNGDAMVFRLGLNFPGQNRQPQAPANGPAAQDGQPPPAVANNQQNNRNQGVRMFNLGPLRLGIAQGGVNDIQEMAQRLGMPADAAADTPPAAPAAIAQPANGGDTVMSLDQIRNQITELYQRVHREAQALNVAAQELQALNFVINDLHRIRLQQTAHEQLQQQGQQGTPAVTPGVPPMPPAALGQIPLPFLPPQHFPHHGHGPLYPHLAHGVLPNMAQPQPQQHQYQQRFTRYGGANYGAAIPAGSPDLPEGMAIPPGWSLLPLQRLDLPVPPTDAPHSTPAGDVNLGLQDPRGNNPAVEAQISDPSSRATAVSTSSTSEQEAPRESEQTPAPAVTSPTPVVPSWNGPAQLFGGSSTASRLGDQRASAHDEPGGGSSSGGGTEQNGNANHKGKAKSATVEEAEEEEHDDDDA